MKRLNDFVKKLWNSSGGSPSVINYVDYVYGKTDESIMLYAHNAIVYYTTIAPVYTAVEMISNAFAQITPVIKINGEIKENHPLLKLLEAPNGDLTYTEYAKQLAAWYLITGNVYISANGSSEKQLPVDLEIISPQFIVPQQSSEDMYVQSYNLSESNNGNVFTRDESSRRFRFYDKDREHELWHIKTFNPNSNIMVGLSPLNAVYYEIEQYLASSKHNKSVLNNGSRTSGVITCEASLTDDQRERISEK